MFVVRLTSIDSTCYLELDVPKKHMLFVNYWDSVVGTMPLTDSGVLMSGESINIDCASFSTIPLFQYMFHQSVHDA